MKKESPHSGGAVKRPGVILALLAVGAVLPVLSSCTTINVTPPTVAAGGSMTILIDAGKTVTTTPSI